MISPNDMSLLRYPVYNMSHGLPLNMLFVNFTFTVDDIEKDISFYYPIDNRNGNRKVGLIRAYFVYSFYNVENDEKICLKNGEMLKVKRGCYTMKDIETVSSGKVKYDSLTGKSVIDSSIIGNSDLI